MDKKIPKELQGILWSRRLESLDLQRDKGYIIHQVLAYGSLEQVKWLFKVYSQKEASRVFLQRPKKLYTSQAFNFVKNYLLPLEKKVVKPELYVKALF